MPMEQRFPEREIVNSRLFSHPPAEIFDAFSNSETLARWWGPAGFTNTFHSFEFEPGGEWFLTMRGPDGQDYENKSFFKEIVEPNRVVIEHVSSPRFVLEVDWEESEDGTLLTWVQRFETAEMKDRVVSTVGSANEENLDRLASVLSET